MLLKEERLRLTLEALREQGKVTVPELSSIFGVSEITIRRDLNELARQGLVRRAHGGAVYPIETPPEPPVIQRMQENRDLKIRIARAAARLVAPGDTIFLSSGSTATYVARQLADRKNLTVVTNSISVATELATAEGITVVVLGGMLRASELSMVGHITEQALREVRIDKVIIGMRAVSPEAGLTNDYLPEIMTDRAILQVAPENILVVDHTKLGKTASAYVAPIDRITRLVTNREADPALLAQIRQMGIEVIEA
ncbi:MAG: DeoR/GlpR transcriptional regulator [Anaerolineae bacterium]|nr:DeoR/GlpR transcriptional regulator [Anaerolineae bacterium]